MHSGTVWLLSLGGQTVHQKEQYSGPPGVRKISGPYHFDNQNGRQQPSGLNGPQEDQVSWRGYLNPKSGSPASILGSPAICSKKAKRFLFPLFMLLMVLMLCSTIL